MRKFRVIVFAITLLLVVVVIAGAVILILSPNNSAVDTAFNIVAFAVSAASVAIALTSQVSAYQDRKKLSQLVRDLNEIDGEVEEDEKNLAGIRRKLTEIEALDKVMNKKLDKIEKNGKKK